MAAQVDEELPVLEVLAPGVRPVLGEGGLADAGRADHRDHVGAGRRVGRDEGVELPHLPPPPDVGAGGGGQLGRERPGGRGTSGWRGVVGAARGGELLAQHPQVGVADLRAGRDAQLLVEPVAQPVEHVERGGLFAAAGEGEDQPGVQAFVQRLGVHQVPQHRDGLLGPAQQQRGVGVEEHGLDAPLVGDHRGGVLAQDGVGVREHGAAPPPQGLRQRRVRGDGVGGAEQPLRVVEEFVEVAEVGLVARGFEEVADGGPDDAGRRTVLFEEPPHLADVGVHEALVGTGRPGRPEDVGDLPLGGGLGVLEREQSEQTAQHRTGEGNGGAAALEGEGAEDEQPGPSGTARRRRGAVGGQQLRQLAAAQLQRLGEPPEGPRLGPPDPPAFDVAQRPGADSGPRGGRLLTQPGPPAERPEPRAERPRPVVRITPGNPRGRRPLRHGIPLIDDRVLSIMTGGGLAGRARPTLQRLRQ